MPARVLVLCGAGVVGAGSLVLVLVVLVGPRVKKDDRSGDLGAYVPSLDMANDDPKVNKTTSAKKPTIF